MSRERISMQENIREGIEVEICFVDCPASAVGTIARVDSKAFVVSLAPENERLAVSVSSLEGRGVRVMAAADDALYRFTATLLRASGRLWHLSFPAKIERVQRRAHVREACLLEVEFVTPLERRVGRCSKATAVNISCGGLRAVYEGRVEVGDHVELSLQFPQDGLPLRLSGAVLRKEEFSRLGRQLSRVTVRFDDLAKADERRLAEFITRLQVRSRRGVTRLR